MVVTDRDGAGPTSEQDQIKGKLLSKRIEQMTATEMASIPKERRESMLQESAVYAIRQSVCHGSVTAANQLLKSLPLVTRNANAKQALIEYLEKWGRLYFAHSGGGFGYSKQHNKVSWSDDHEAQVMSDSWTSYIKPPEKPDSEVLDADKEFRKVLDRLKRASSDPTKTVLHSVLVSKVQEVLYAYGRSDECTREEQRGRTLFDQSVARKSTRASKFAKGT